MGNLLKTFKKTARSEKIGKRMRGLFSKARKTRPRIKIGTRERESYLAVPLEIKLELEDITSGSRKKYLELLFSATTTQLPIYSSHKEAFDYLSTQTLTTDSYSLVFKLSLDKQEAIDRVSNPELNWCEDIVQIFDRNKESVWVKENPLNCRST